MNSKNCKFKVIATNKATKHLDGAVFQFPNFVISSSSNITTTQLDGENFTFEIKNVNFLDCGILLDGFVSGESLSVGRISLKYLP
ncbi:MAG: hypothetical protein HWN81_05805 [Candidatus Lokiarchaeota archaeon]|nr:hypothetical protein [Candidatus Lokiarchaeota archaeon]